ncbi:unnamed protein product [Thlaspi arvense]|uniref:AT3G52170-like helix-turn-helix domain-containing protein n=1 Tax=Thlaspi arvense TaxID=13288 RepID=A0AAU9SMD0_THLAR|nr:unnamed protein product [Thlaspi arvense]
MSYRAANAGKFPTFYATFKEVGGSYYVVRDILQELKLKPNAPLPIVAKALSQAPAFVPIDTSSQTLYDADTEHVSSVVADTVFQDGSPDTIETGSDQGPSTKDFSRPISDESDLQGNDLVIAETGSDQSLGTIETGSDEIDLQGNNLVIAATHDKTATEIAPNDDVDSKCDSDSNSHLPESQTLVSEECFKNSGGEEEEKLTKLGSQESKADHLEEIAVSANILPTETRLVSAEKDGEVKTGERSSAWSNIMSLAKDFANFWRKE